MQNIDTDLIISCILPTSGFYRRTAFQVEIATNLSVTLPQVSKRTRTRNYEHLKMGNAFAFYFDYEYIRDRVKHN